MQDISFYNIVFPILSLMPIFALAIICLILKHGQLCPGQHSRIQAELITIWTVLFVGVMIGAETQTSTWVLVVGGLGGAYGILLSIWQGKLPNKRAIPDKAIYFAMLPLTIYGLVLIWMQPSWFVLLPMAITGAVLANLLLVKARHRLEAFNRLLPYGGIVGTILSLVLVSWTIYAAGEGLFNADMQRDLLWALGFLLLGLSLWVLPLVSDNPQSNTLLGIATFLLLIAQILTYEVVVLLTINMA